MTLITETFISYLANKALDGCWDRIASGVGSDTRSHDDLARVLNASIKEELSAIDIEFEKKEIEELIDMNKELIYECVLDSSSVFRKYEFNSDKVVHVNYDNESNETRFLNGLLNNLHSKIQTTFSIPERLIFDSLEKQLVQLQTIKDQLKPSLPNLQFSAELNSVESLINEHKYNEARNILKALEDKVLQTADRIQIERMLQLFSDSYLLSEYEQAQAVPYLKRLINYTDSEVTKKRRTALLYLLCNEFGKAFDILDSIDLSTIANEEKVKVVNTKLNAGLLYRKNEFLNQLEKERNNTDSYPIWKSQYFLSIHNPDAAYKAYEEFVDYFNRDEFAICRMKFVIQLTYYSEIFRQSKTPLTLLSRLSELLVLADKLLKECGDVRQIQAELHSQKAYILLLLNRVDDADYEFRQAGSINPKCILYLRYYPLILINSSDSEKNKLALRLLDEAKSSQEIDENGILFYYSVLATVDPNKFISEYSTIENSSSLRYLLIDAYDNMNEIKRADEVVEKVLLEQSSDINAILHVTKHWRFTNKIDRAITFLESQNPARFEFSESVFLIQTISTFYLIKNESYFFNKVITVIESSFNEECIGFYFREEYSEALFRANQYSKCILFSNKMNSLGLMSSSLLRRELYSLYSTRNIIAFIDRFQLLFQRKDANPEDYYYYVEVFIEIGKKEKAKEFISRLPPPDTVTEHLTLIRLQALVGDNENAIETASKAFKKYPFDRRIMEAFITLVITQSTNITIRPEVIESYRECFNRYDEMPYPQKILKKIDLPLEMTAENIAETLKREIIMQGQVSLETIDEYFESIRKNHMPISFITRLKKTNYIYIWDTVIHSKDCFIWAGWGNDKDHEEQRSVKYTQIYIDLCSLLTLDEINMIEYLPKYFDKVNICQSIVDELVSCVHEIENTAQPSAFVSLDSREQLIMCEYQEEYHKKILTKAKRILDFIDNNRGKLTIVGQPILTTEKHSPLIDSFVKINELHYETDPFVYAILCNTVAFLESNIMREAFLREDGNAGCFGIMSFLCHVAENEKWTYRQYHHQILKLLGLNYRYCEINASLFIQELREYGYHLQEHTEKVISILGDRSYSISKCSEISTVMIIDVWSSHTSEYEKKQISTTIISCLVKRGDFPEVAISEMCRIVYSLINTNKNQEAFFAYYLENKNSFMH
jgi:hypothetical protein